MATHTRKVAGRDRKSGLNGHTMITLREAMCPVCRDIITEPVTMPCEHFICLQCLKMTEEKSNFTCPLCRRRLNSWFRTAIKKGQQLINQKLWEYIKSSFPDLVNAKLNGIETSDEIFNGSPKKRIISSAGEIRRDYEKCLEEARMEEEAERKKREKQERASLQFIQNLQEEENRKKQEEQEKIRQEQKTASESLIKLIQAEEDLKRRKEAEQARLDEELAKELQEKSSQRLTLKLTPPDIRDASKKASSSSIKAAKKGPMDLFVTANRSLSNLSDCSHDSIVLETQHFFKPLRAFPITPPKRSQDGKAQKTPLIRAQPMNLTYPIESMGICGDLKQIHSAPSLGSRLTSNTLLYGDDPSTPHVSAFSGRRALFADESLPLSREPAAKKPRLVSHTITSADQSPTDCVVAAKPLVTLPPSAVLRLDDLGGSGGGSPSSDSSSTSDSGSFDAALGAAFSDSMHEQQRVAEMILCQERSDFLLAQELQKEYDSSSSVFSSYSLRHKQPPPRQATLHESFGGKPSRTSTKATPKKRGSLSNQSSTSSSATSTDKGESPAKRPAAAVGDRRKPVGRAGSLFAPRSLDVIISSPGGKGPGQPPPSLRDLLEGNVKRYNEEEKQKRLRLLTGEV